MRWKYLVAATVVSAFLIPGTAMAGPPAQVPVQGYLTDSDGVPLDGQTSITVKIFDAKSGGSALHTEQQTVQPKAGSFTAHLGKNQALDLSMFRDNDNLWVEVTVEGEVLDPRLRIATAPYAASAGFAQDAAKVGGKSVSELQKPDWGDIENKPSQFGETYSAGDGLQLNNGKFSVDPTQVQSRIDGNCPSGQFAVGVEQDGSLICNQAATVTAGSGLVKSGTTMSVDTNAVQTRVNDTCGQNEKIIGINKDGTVQCIADKTGGDIDSVTAGSGLSGGGTSGDVSMSVASKGVDGSHLSDKLESSDIEFSGSGSSRSLNIPSRSVDQTEIAKTAVSDAELADDAVISSKIKNGAVTSSEIDDGTVTGQDIGEYPCDQGSTNTGFTKITGCEDTFGSPSDIPNCDEVPVGGVCEADTSACANADSSSDHCSNSIYEVYLRTSW